VERFGTGVVVTGARIVTGTLSGSISQGETYGAQKLVDVLDEDDPAWLDARLEEYRDLLVYLHDH
jgi:hypothetical protein